MLARTLSGRITSTCPDFVHKIAPLRVSSRSYRDQPTFCHFNFPYLYGGIHCLVCNDGAKDKVGRPSRAPLDFNNLSSLQQHFIIWAQNSMATFTPNDEQLSQFPALLHSAILVGSVAGGRRWPNVIMCEVVLLG